MMAMGTADDGLAMPRRGWAAMAIWLAMAITVLDTAIANVALPTIGHALNAAPAQVVGVVKFYQIAIIATILTLAALGEIVGYRWIYLGGLALFTAASCACALAPNLDTLVLARFCQGLGAAGIMSVNGALVRFTFPAARLGRAFGINALVIAMAGMAAPLVAGVILAALSWRWLFGINLVFGGLSLVAGALALPVARGGARALDTRAALLFSAASVCLFLALQALTGGRHPAWQGVALALAGGLCAALLVLRARGQERPLLPFDLIRQPVLRRAYLASICNFVAQALVLVGLPFYLHARFGLGALATGLVMATIPLGMGAVALHSGRRADRTAVGRGSGHGDGGGLILAALALAGMGLLRDSGPATLAIAGLVAGAGFGLFQPPNNRIMIDMPARARSGAAAGMLALSRLCGQLCGAGAAALLLRLYGAVDSPFIWAAAIGAVLGALAVGRPSAGTQN